MRGRGAHGRHILVYAKLSGRSAASRLVGAVARPHPRQQRAYLANVVARVWKPRNETYAQLAGRGLRIAESSYLVGLASTRVTVEMNEAKQVPESKPT